MHKIDPTRKLELVRDFWSPKAIGAVNDFLVKVVKLQGEFVWHSHETEDELFFVLRGTLLMQFRDGEVAVGPGELIIVPHGVEHRPVADEGEDCILLVAGEGPSLPHSTLGKIVAKLIRF